MGFWCDVLLSTAPAHLHSQGACSAIRLPLALGRRLLAINSTPYHRTLQGKLKSVLDLCYKVLATDHFRRNVRWLAQKNICIRYAGGANTIRRSQAGFDQLNGP